MLMTRRKLVVAAAVIVASALSVAGLGGAGAGATRSAGPAARATCRPVSALPGGPFEVEAVLRALRRQIPTLYKGLTDMGDPVPINARTYEIEGVIRLPYAPRRSFAQPFRKLALSICPAKVVDRSWVVSLSLTRVQLPASARIVFLAKTSAGWTAWYHS
jgi:hypothetical protein